MFFLTALLRPEQASDWMFVMFIVMLGVVAVLVRQGQGVVTFHLQSLYSLTAQNRLFTEDAAKQLGAPTLLNIVFLLGLSVFIIASDHAMDWGLLTVDSQVMKILLVVAFVGGFYLIKNMLIGFSGFVFEVKPYTQKYASLLNLFNRILGLLFIPLALAITYVDVISAQNIVILGGVIFSGVHVLRFFWMISTALSLSGVSKFQLFLYLCTLEILPFVVILTALTRQIG